MRWEPRLVADKRPPELTLVTAFDELVDVVSEADVESVAFVGFFLRVTGVGLHDIYLAEADFVDTAAGSFSLSVKIEHKS